MQKTVTRRKKILVAVAGALALAAALVLIILRAASPTAAGHYAVLYAKGGGNLSLATPEGVFPLQGGQTQRQVFTEDGAYLYYDSAEGETRSVYMLRLKESAARKEGGKPVAKGAVDWTVSADGRWLCYVESKGRTLQRYDAQRETTQELTAGVASFYAAPGQDVFFFTKEEGEGAALFRCQVGQQPERLSDAVLEARLCSDETQCALFFQRGSGGTAALYALGATGAPVLVAEDVAAVLLDDYRLGGNLYFFQRGQGAAAATLTLEDPQQAADAALKAPVKPSSPLPGRGGILSGILGGLGQILTGGNTAYEQQQAAYQAKQERDKVREAAQAALKALPEQGAALLDCYVYDGARVQLLAQGVRAQAQTVPRPFGRPALLFEKERAIVTEESQSVTLTELLMHYRAGGEAAVREYIAQLAVGGAEPAGLVLAVMTDAGPNEIPMGQAVGGGAGWQAAFLPGAEELLYLERDVEGGPFSLYSFELTQFGVSERRLAGANAARLTPAGAGAYFFQQEPGAPSGALFWYQSGKSAKVLTGAGAFFLAGDGDTLLALGDVRDGAGTLHALNGGQALALGGGVKIDGIRAGGGCVCYLTQWSAGAGTLNLQALVGKSPKARVLDTGVTEIIAVGN